MPRSVLDAPRFKDEAAAYAYVESIVWESGRFCPHCGVVGESGPLKGKSTRIGLYKCYACRKPFTVKIGTIFEKSHVPMHIWLQAMHLMCSSKKGFSANQFSRILGVDLKTGWFIGHRIREAMRDNGFTGPLGGEGYSSRPMKPISAEKPRTAPIGSRLRRRPSSRWSSVRAVSAPAVSWT